MNNVKISVVTVCYNAWLVVLVTLNPNRTLISKIFKDLSCLQRKAA